MKDPIKHGYVNWIDGMKIGKDHFMDFQHAVEDRLRDARALASNAYSFGLLPGEHNGRQSLEYNLFIERPNIVNIELIQCRAIAPNGERIEVIEGLSDKSPFMRGAMEIDLDGAKDTRYWDILLRVNSFEPSTYGTPDVEESPPRHPFNHPKYAFECVPSNSLKYADYNRHYAILARMEVKNGELEHLASFIPPSMTVQSHASLSEFYFKYHKFQKDMERFAFKIITNLNRKEQNTKLALNVYEMCKRVIGFLERETDSYRIVMGNMPPVHIIAHAMRFARTLKNSFELITGKGKDEVLNYVKEVSDYTPGEYIGALDQLLAQEYNHYNIHESLSKVLVFCTMNNKLFEEWSGLDYIGKKKKSDVFVAEKPQDHFSSGKKNTGAWDF